MVVSVGVLLQIHRFGMSDCLAQVRSFIRFILTALTFQASIRIAFLAVITIVEQLNDYDRIDAR